MSQHDHEAAQPRAWTCPRCEADNEPALGQCWRCGTFADGSVDPAFQAEVEPTQARDHCKRCGYPLYGLDAARCPECGTEFDPDAYDTPRPELPRDPRAEHERRCWLAVWSVSWVLTLVLIVAKRVFSFGEAAFAEVFFLVAAVTFGVALLAPFVFVLKLFK